MAQIILDIPDAQVARVVDAFCARFDYTGYVASGGTMTRNQFTKSRIARWVRNVTTTWEMQQSLGAVAQPVEPDVT